MSDLTTIRDQARFVVPRRAEHTVVLSRLDERFAAARGRVLRVVAPPGYGKSTLVGRWVGDDDRSVRWLELERIDNDPVVLMGTLARGLGDLVDDPRALVSNFPAHDRRFADVAVPAFGAAIRAIAEPFVIVVDDTHRVSDPVTWLLLDCLARSVPPSSTVVFIGRGVSHGLSLPAMRLDPGVVDITTSDLSLDVVETEQLLVAHGVHLDLDAVADLTARFEGWPAGLRLLSLALATPDGQRHLELARAGELAYVTDYLRAEWLLTLSDGDRRFLMEVAVLRRFSADMCDQVLDRRGSAATIRRLEHEKVMVLPLDRRGAWYRMHGLLRDWLETELRHTDRARWQEVHRDAARWWEQADDIDLAVQHLELIDDAARREELVIAHAATFVMKGMSSTVRRWLSGFTHEQIGASTGLCVVSAGVEFSSGQGTSGMFWLSLLTDAPDRGSWSGDATQLVLWAEIQRASVEVGPAAALLEQAERARSKVTFGPWHVYGSLMVGALRAITGKPGAIDVLLDGAREAAIVGVHAQRALCLSFAAILSDLDGDREAAITHGGEAYRVVKESALDDAVTAATATAAAHGLILARSGRRREALACLDVCGTALPGFAGLAPWYNVLTRMAMVTTALLVGDPTQGAQWLREIEHHLRFEPDEGGLRDRVAALRLRVDAACDVSVARSWSLTTAELRVLQYLPTNHSLAYIASQLFVSRNTVKSHTAAIYRKFGTTSRSETVRLARDAGLLADAPPHV